MTEINSQGNQPQKTRKDLEIELIQQAWLDDEFKQKLISDPKLVLEKALGKELPRNLNIQVIEETPDTLYIILPSKLNCPELEAPRGMPDRPIGSGMAAYGCPPWASTDTFFDEQ
jgi:hypothetical protein